MPSTIAAIIPSPDPRQLLQPLLACLPFSAFSNRPPPDLLPLLSPILRQRLQLLAAGTSPSQQSWLSLLNWNRDEGAKLSDLLHEISFKFEPHPVSGEVEIEDVDQTQFRRLDGETLHTRFTSSQFQIVATYLWCMGDENNGGFAWRLSELKRLDDDESDGTWFGSLQEAETKFQEQFGRLAPPSINGTKDQKAAATQSDGVDEDDVDDDEDDEDDDDDAYWAAYDQTPASRTPAKHSPAPGAHPGLLRNQSTSNESDYYNRYETEVQPALDPYDPSEDQGVPDSTLNHHAREYTSAPRTDDADSSTVDVENPAELVISVPEIPHQPRPLSSSSRSSVEKLEREANKNDENGTQSHAEIGIKQHISTDIKSLYRLSRSVGITREEFGRIVRTELDCLGMMDYE